MLNKCFERNSTSACDFLSAANGSSNNHLVHLQVDVRRPHLGVQVWVVGISGVVLQAAALLQVGLELLSAPPTGRDKKKKNRERTYFSERFDHHQLNHSESCGGTCLVLSPHSKKVLGSIPWWGGACVELSNPWCIYRLLSGALKHYDPGIL